MPDITTLLLAYIALNAAVSLVWLRFAGRDFKKLGRWTRPVAVASGILMHGQALASWALAYADRGSLYSPGLASISTGVILFLAGAGVIAAGRLAYGSQERVYGLLEDELIETGIYRWTRNPQYTGYALMFFGASLAWGSGLAFLATAVFLIFVHLFITRVEEPHLRRVFGPAYADYCHRVRRYA